MVERLDSVTLESGATLAPVDVAYADYGSRDAPVILVHHALTATPGVDWWDALVGPERPVDTNRFRVINRTCSAAARTTGPTSIDPATGEPYGLTFRSSRRDLVSVQRAAARARHRPRAHRDRRLAGRDAGAGGRSTIPTSRAPLICCTARLTAQNIAFTKVAREESWARRDGRRAHDGPHHVPVGRVDGAEVRRSRADGPMTLSPTTVEHYSTTRRRSSSPASTITYIYLSRTMDYASRSPSTAARRPRYLVVSFDSDSASGRAFAAHRGAAARARRRWRAGSARRGARLVPDGRPGVPRPRATVHRMIPRRTGDALEILDQTRLPEERSRSRDRRRGDRRAPAAGGARRRRSAWRARSGLCWRRVTRSGSRRRGRRRNLRWAVERVMAADDRRRRRSRSGARIRCVRRDRARRGRVCASARGSSRSAMPEARHDRDRDRAGAGLREGGGGRGGGGVRVRDAAAAPGARLTACERPPRRPDRAPDGAAAPAGVRRVEADHRLRPGGRQRRRGEQDRHAGPGDRRAPRRAVLRAGPRSTPTPRRRRGEGRSRSSSGTRASWRRSRAPASGTRHARRRRPRW